jgi:hypothetical protein
MLGTTDWLLKRFLKFVLKRNIGKYLTSEIDLEQLDVKLDTGTLELKNLLLNCDALNKDLVGQASDGLGSHQGATPTQQPFPLSSELFCGNVLSEITGLRGIDATLYYSPR